MAETPGRTHLTALYGEADGLRTHAALRALLERYPRRPGAESAEGRLPLSERDALLITYGDQVKRSGEPPLRTLAASKRSVRMAGFISNGTTAR